MDRTKAVATIKLNWWQHEAARLQRVAGYPDREADILEAHRFIEKLEREAA